MDSAAKTTQQPLIEIKGGSFVIPVVKLHTTDVDAIASEVEIKVSQAPDFFRNAPVVIDLKTTTDIGSHSHLNELVNTFKNLGMTLVGIQHGTPEDHQLAQKLGLARMPEGRAERKPLQPQDGNSAMPGASSPVKKTSTPIEPDPVTPHSLTVTQPIRSGQRIYSPGDLIVLSQVSNGAEVMADGNIHIYGTLRGRALAGVRGDMESRIFCRDLQAELISIAGNYRISENLENQVRNKPVQIYLDNDALIIEDI